MGLRGSVWVCVWERVREGDFVCMNLHVIRSIMTIVCVSLTSCSQYGGDVCGWTLLHPSSRSDWVPHCTGGPGENHQ